MLGVVLLIAACVSTAAEPKLAEIESGFGKKAFAHIEKLASFGNRVTGTEGEAKAIRYVRKAMKERGLAVTVEPFEFDSYTLAAATLKLGKVEYPVERLGFDPYSGPRTFRGEAAFVDANTVREWKHYSKLELEGKIAVASTEANMHRLMLKQPEVVALLSPKDFEKAKGAASGAVEIVTTGTRSRIPSANVIGTLSPDSATSDEVILSAHLDSWSGPGAADNASGVGVLLELARHLSSVREQLPFRVKFIAFGGEELGLMGSKAYLKAHLPELNRCRLLFNMDSIGGKEMFVEMRGGVRNVPEAVMNPLPEDLIDKATHDLNAKWLMNRTDSLAPDASNVPEWLQAAIKTTASELGYEFTAVRGAGSDHRTFAPAGVVSTNIGNGGLKTHSPDDVPKQINIESLEKSARMVLGVLGRVRVGD